MENPHKSNHSSKLNQSNKFLDPHKVKAAHSVSASKLCLECQKNTSGHRDSCRRSESVGCETFLKFNYKYKRRSVVDRKVVNDAEIEPNVPKFEAISREKTVRKHSTRTTTTSQTTPDMYKYQINDANIASLQWFKWKLCRYWLRRYVKMISVCSLNVIVIFFVIMMAVADVGEAGVCWVARESNGKCMQRFSSNMSEKECCQHPDRAFTERELTDVELFFASAIDDGAKCKSCLDSCETAKCGPGKRCVYRKGKPKCVCAPVCRSSKPKNALPTTVGFDRPTPPASSTQYAPSKYSKEPRPFPPFLKLGSLEAALPVARGGRDTFAMAKSHTTSKKPSTSISQNMKRNSEIRWRHDFQSPSFAEALKSNRNETEVLASSTKQRRKNQRKSKNMSKRRRKTSTMKTSTTAGAAVALSEPSLQHQAEIVEGLTSSFEHQDDSPKSGRIIITADRANRNLDQILHPATGRVPNFGSVNLNSANEAHHQYKKQSNVNFTSAISSGMPLDDKIRSGFFGYSFPFPNAEEFQQQHGNGRYYNPVCGTDGKTYKTECQLKKRACRRESTTLAVAYRGHCQTSCKFVGCLNNLTCVEDQYGLPHCIPCSISCPQDDATTVIDPARAVCGVDGITYKSVCDINRLICTTGRSIAVAYHGLCQEKANCFTIQCRDKQVCIRDLMTNKPRCISCSFKCPRKRKPKGHRNHRNQEHKICGTNNFTYNSWCHMRRESCNTGYYIDVKHTGTCEKISEPYRPNNT